MNDNLANSDIVKLLAFPIAVGLPVLIVFILIRMRRMCYRLLSRHRKISDMTDRELRKLRDQTENGTTIQSKALIAAFNTKFANTWIRREGVVDDVEADCIRVGGIYMHPIAVTTTRVLSYRELMKIRIGDKVTINIRVILQTKNTACYELVC
jgi:hypothetical protein